jgi:hypothetical protein
MTPRSRRSYAGVAQLAVAMLLLLLVPAVPLALLADGVVAGCSAPSS